MLVAATNNDKPCNRGTIGVCQCHTMLWCRRQMHSCTIASIRLMVQNHRHDKRDRDRFNIKFRPITDYNLYFEIRDMITMGRPCIKRRIICRAVSEVVTGFPVCDWCRISISCPLYVGPLLEKLFSRSWSANLIICLAKVFGVSGKKLETGRNSIEFCLYGLTIIRAWMKCEIKFAINSQTSTVANVEVWRLIRKLIPHLTGCATMYPCWD